MVYVYVLKSLKSGRRYVGLTGDVERRLGEHNAGRSRSTCRELPWRLIYEESFSDYASGREREKYLKSSAGRRFLKDLEEEE